MMNLVKSVKEKLTPEIKYILFLFLSTRIALTIIGIISRIIFENKGEHLWYQIWCNWDCGWYLDIASNGYSLAHPNSLSLQANYNFLPVFPILTRYFGTLFKDLNLAGVVVSNIALIIACIILYKLVRLDSTEETSKKTIKYLFLFPTAFIFSAVMSESVFLVLLLATFYSARKNKWLLAGIFGFFLALSRFHGILAFIPILYIYLKQKEFNFKNINLNILFLFLIPLGLFTFAMFTYNLTGDPLSFIKIHKQWGEIGMNPITNLIQNLKSTDIGLIFGSWFTIIGALFITTFYKKIDISYLILSIIFILIPLLQVGPLCSMPRFFLPIFPLYIILAKISKKEETDILLTIFLALIQGFLMVFWSNGYTLIV